MYSASYTMATHHIMRTFGRMLQVTNAGGRAKRRQLATDLEVEDVHLVEPPKHAKPAEPGVHVRLRWAAIPDDGRGSNEFVGMLGLQELSPRFELGLRGMYLGDRRYIYIGEEVFDVERIE